MYAVEDVEIELDEGVSWSDDLAWSVDEESDSYSLCCNICIPVCCNGLLICTGCAPCTPTPLDPNKRKSLG